MPTGIQQFLGKGKSQLFPRLYCYERMKNGRHGLSPLPGLTIAKKSCSLQACANWSGHTTVPSPSRRALAAAPAAPRKQLRAGAAAPRVGFADGAH